MMKTLFLFYLDWLSIFFSYEYFDSFLSFSFVSNFYHYLLTLPINVDDDIYGNNLDSDSSTSSSSSDFNVVNLDNMVNTHNIIIKNNFNLDYKGGFKSYNMINVFKNVIFKFNSLTQMLTIDKEILLNNLSNFLNKLEDNKTYSVLFVANSWAEHRIVASSFFEMKNCVMAIKYLAFHVTSVFLANIGGIWSGMLMVGEQIETAQQLC